MLPSFHQSNVYLKRNLQVWIVQKCIPLVGAKTILTCVGRQTTQYRVSQFRAENGDLRKCGSTFRHGTVFALKQCLYQKAATGMESPKYIPLVGAKTILICVGRQTTQYRVSQFRAENGDLRKCGSTFRHGTVFALKQCLYQKEATGMEILKMHSSSRCKNRTYLYGRQTTPSHVSQYRAENGNLRKSGSTFRYGTVVEPKQCLYQKEATRMETPKMHFSSL